MTQKNQGFGKAWRIISVVGLSGLLILSLQVAQGARRPVQSQEPRKPVVTVESAQTSHSFAVSEATPVGEALGQQGFRLEGKDFFSVPSDRLVESDLTIRLHHVSEEILFESETTTYGATFVPAYEVPLGQRKTVVAGIPGELQVVYLATKVDGQITEKYRLGHTLQRQPEAAVIGIGVFISSPDAAVQASLAFPPPQGPPTYEMEATAYCPLPEETDSDPWSTSVGLRSGYGIVAVDPRVIPYYTPLYIEGYGYAIAGDTGGAIHGERIDVFFYTYQETVSFGRRPIKVWVLK
jgi:3D (Asp-Asp-Asp) domain-containing protein